MIKKKNSNSIEYYYALILFNLHNNFIIQILLLFTIYGLLTLQENPIVPQHHIYIQMVFQQREDFSLSQHIWSHLEEGITQGQFSSFLPFSFLRIQPLQKAETLYSAEFNVSFWGKVFGGLLVGRSKPTSLTQLLSITKWMKNNFISLMPCMGCSMDSKLVWEKEVFKSHQSLLCVGRRGDLSTHGPRKWHVTTRLDLRLLTPEIMLFFTSLY